MCDKTLHLLWFAVYADLLVFKRHLKALHNLHYVIKVLSSYSVFLSIYVKRNKRCQRKEIKEDIIQYLPHHG